MQSERPTLLEELLANPDTVSECSPGDAAALLEKLSCLQAALFKLALTRGVASSRNYQPPSARTSINSEFGATAAAWSQDDLLTIDEAAKMLCLSPRWLYRHAKTLPFTRKLSRKVLRFSRSGITRWLTTKRP